MKVTGKIDILVSEDGNLSFGNRFLINGKICEQCGEQMISERVGAEFFGISRRTIYRLVEAGKVHFCKTDENVGFICLKSLGDNAQFARRGE